MGTSKPEGIQLFLNNDSFIKYPYMKQMVRSFIYLQSSHKMLFCTYRNILTMSSLDGNKNEIIERNIRAYEFGVGEDKVFIATSRSILIMTPDCRNLKLLTKLKTPVRSMAVDTKRSVLYMGCMRDFIEKYTFKGVKKGKIHFQERPRLLYIEPSTDLLYYVVYSKQQLYTTIWTMSLHDSRNTMLAQHEHLIDDVCVLDNTVYAIDTGVILVSGKNSRTIKCNTSSLTFCGFIP